MKYSGHYKEFVLYVPVLLLFLGVWHAFFYFDRKSEEKEVATYRK